MGPTVNHHVDTPKGVRANQEVGKSESAALPTWGNSYWRLSDYAFQRSRRTEKDQSRCANHFTSTDACTQTSRLPEFSDVSSPTPIPF